LVMDFGPNPAGPDDKDIQIGHLIIQKLAHLNESNFSETIGRIPRKRTIRATPCNNYAFLTLFSKLQYLW
jgi:hypothetical protein